MKNQEHQKRVAAQKLFMLANYKVLRSFFSEESLKNEHPSFLIAVPESGGKNYRISCNTLDPELTPLLPQELIGFIIKNSGKITLAFFSNKGEGDYYALEN